MYPEICVQQIVLPSAWWEENGEQRVCRGALITAFVPHFDQIPYRFEPVGRTDPEQHTEAVVRVTPLRVDAPLKPVDLPVAAMPLNANEVWGAYRAKRRPCVVLGESAPAVEKSLVQGKPRSATAPTLLVAPFYGASQKRGQRAGYTKEFVDRVRQCEYPQFLWDDVPGGEESILRLDQIQPIGAHHDSHRLTKYRLSRDALQIVDEMITWLIMGGVEANSLIASYRKLIESAPGAT